MVGEVLKDTNIWNLDSFLYMEYTDAWNRSEAIGQVQKGELDKNEIISYFKRYNADYITNGLNRDDVFNFVDEITNNHDIAHDIAHNYLDSKYKEANEKDNKLERFTIPVDEAVDDLFKALGDGSIIKYDPTAPLLVKAANEARVSFYGTGDVEFNKIYNDIVGKGGDDLAKKLDDNYVNLTSIYQTLSAEEYNNYMDNQIKSGAKVAEWSNSDFSKAISHASKRAKDVLHKLATMERIDTVADIAKQLNKAQPYNSLGNYELIMRFLDSNKIHLYPETDISDQVLASQKDLERIIEYNMKNFNIYDLITPELNFTPTTKVGYIYNFPQDYVTFNQNEIDQIAHSETNKSYKAYDPIKGTGTFIGSMTNYTYDYLGGGVRLEAGYVNNAPHERQTNSDIAYQNAIPTLDNFGFNHLNPTRTTKR